MRAIFDSAALVPDRAPGWSTRAARRAREFYRTLATSAWFGRGLIAFFVAQFLARLVRVIALFVPLPTLGERLLSIPLINPERVQGAEMNATQWLLLGSNVLAAVFIALGVVAVMRGRLRQAMQHFQRSVLVTIVLTQVFVFYRVEWFGLVEFTFYLLVFFTLRFMIERETADEES